MKRMLVSLFACAIVFLNLVVAGTAQAQPFAAISFPHLQLAKLAEPTETTKDLITQLETEIIPRIENVLTPEQREQFNTAVGEGTAFRKAFKSLALTPEQKTQLKAVFKELPKKDVFASLTPEQKKALFLKKKQMFMPTPEEITDKINAGMKYKGTSIPEKVSDKINQKLDIIKSKMEE